MSDAAGATAGDRLLDASGLIAQGLLVPLAQATAMGVTP